MGGQGFFVERETVVMAPLFEGDYEDIGHLSAEDAPGHFNIGVSNNRDWGRDGGFGEGTTECPAAEDVPLVDFGVAFEFGELVFGGRGEFDAIDWGFHDSQLSFYLTADERRWTQMNTDEIILSAFICVYLRFKNFGQHV